jgi:hypothetical protein
LGIAVCLLLVWVTTSTDPRALKRSNRASQSDSASLVSPLVLQLTAEAWVAHQALAIHLLGQPSVIEELKVTDEQQSVIRTITTNGLQIVTQNRGLVLGESESEDRWTAFVRSVQPIADEVDEKLRDTLDPAQYARLTELTLQTLCGPLGIVDNGPIVLLQPRVAEAIGLTGEQRQAIAEQTERTRSEIAEVGTVGRLFAVERTIGLLREGRQRAEGVLRPGQFARWQTLQGPPLQQ